MASLFISRFSIPENRKPEFVRRLYELYKAAKPILDAETTVLWYGWSRSGQFIAIESYRNEDTLNAMRATDGFQSAFAGLMECTDANMTLEIFSGIDLANPSFAHDKRLFDEIYPQGESRYHAVLDGKKTLLL